MVVIGLDTTALVVLWLFGCAVVGYIAQTKGRNAIAWFGLSLLASPILVGIAVLLVSPARRPQA